MKKSTSTVVFSLALLLLLLPALVCADATEKVALGKLLYEDISLSLEQNQSCETCHMAPGFADPVNAANPETLPVSEGSVVGLFGGRNAPSSAYAAASPKFAYVDGVGYVGGQFWDGRAKGLKEQAKGPFLNPVEMAMPSSQDVVEAVVASGGYDESFESVYGVVLGEIDTTDPLVVKAMYDYIADAIATYERSWELNKFNSIYDTAPLSDFEAEGKALFDAHCSQCHPSEGVTTAHRALVPTVFSNFTYHNLGLPHNETIDELLNLPKGKDPIDLGLGGREDINDPAEYGKFKTPTLRNIDLTAPYGHNGYFASLEEMVSFLNDRSRFPKAEVKDNMTTEVGDLGLSIDQEAAIVAFLKTLSDQ